MRSLPTPFLLPRRKDLTDEEVIRLEFGALDEFPPYEDELHIVVNENWPNALVA